MNTNMKLLVGVIVGFFLYYGVQFFLSVAYPDMSPLLQNGIMLLAVLVFAGVAYLIWKVRSDR